MLGMLVSDDQNSWAMRHRGRRAKQLAVVLRAKWEDVVGANGLDLSDAAARLSDEGWANAATEVARLTGKPFGPPSETTKQITIGYLADDSVKGLIR